MKIYLIIPTYNAGLLWDEVIHSIKNQYNVVFDVIVIDSSSKDLTADKSAAAEFKLISISSEDFNHGGTRNIAAKLNLDADIFIFMTQDAILDNTQALYYIIEQFRDPQIAAVCARQLPHDNANPLAVHARLFNYPVNSDCKSQYDIPRLGLKTVFMSNSFSAYRSKVFFELGGFPDNTILAEDMYLAAKMIKAGYKISYCAEATVKHSHNYTPWEEFRRYFDTGVFHASELWIQAEFGGVRGEGMKFIQSELIYLFNNAPLWIPRALVTNTCKFIGYKLGINYKKLPSSWRVFFSMYKSYWTQQLKKK